jgi:phage terminase small subunit
MAAKSKAKTAKAKPAKKPRQKYSIDDPVYRQMADEYMRNGRNKTQAYLSVFPDTKYDSARTMAPFVFADVGIRAYIDECEADVQATYKLTRERVMQELSRLAFSDLRSLYHPDGTIKAPADLDDETAAAVASIETQELFDGKGEDKKHIGTAYRPKLHDKGAALRDAMKMLGMFEKDNRQKTDPIRDLLETISARGAGLPIKR